MAKKLLNKWREICEWKYSGQHPAISLYMVRQSVYRTLIDRHDPETVIRHAPKIAEVLNRARDEVKRREELHKI